MKINTQQKLVEIRNELQAQKVYSGLAYSQILLPENTPTQTYSSTASLSGSGIVASVRFRFARTDGMIEAPAVNFTFDCTTSPTYADYVRNKGFTISGSDLGYFDQWAVSGYVKEIGDGYADFYVDINAMVRSAFFDLASMSFYITCQAITNVKGTLSVERIK